MEEASPPTRSARAGIENAVRAGVDSIEHGSQITARGRADDEGTGTFHVPTISALREIVENPDEVPSTRSRRRRR